VELETNESGGLGERWGAALGSRSIRRGGDRDGCRRHCLDVFGGGVERDGGDRNSRRELQRVADLAGGGSVVLVDDADADPGPDQEEGEEGRKPEMAA
jgi:hypothetical protein